MKKILIISLLFTSLFVTSCSKKTDNTEKSNNNENIISQNTNPNVVKKQEIEGLLFDNIILKTNNNMSYFTANVTNTTDEKINVKYIKITVYDNENKELFSFNNYIGDYIESKSTLKLSSNIEGDLTTIYSVKYEVIKKLGIIPNFFLAKKMYIEYNT